MRIFVCVVAGDTLLTLIGLALVSSRRERSRFGPVPSHVRITRRAYDWRMHEDATP